MSHTDPFPPPMNIRLSHIDNGSITFTWNDVVKPVCPVLYYNISATNCGNCPLKTNETSIECTDLQVTSERRVCSLSVRTVVCDNLIGIVSDNTNAIIQGM